MYDPTIPLQTRYDRSASIHRSAIESPMDQNPYNTAQRMQQQPKRIARGTVRNKTRAYLSNFDEGEEVEGEEGNFDSWPEEEGDNYSGMPEDDDYLYDYEEGDSRLDDSLFDDETPPLRANNPRKRAAYDREKAGRSYNQILSEINAEQVQEGELSDLDNDLEDEVTDPYNHQQGGIQRGGGGGREYDSYDGMPPPNGSTGVSKSRAGTICSSHSVRSASDHSAAASSVNQNADNRSHGSFRYRAPGGSSASNHASSHAAPGHSRQSSFSSATTPLASTSSAHATSARVASPYFAASSPLNSRLSSRANSRAHSPVPAQQRAVPAPLVMDQVNTSRHSVGGRLIGGISPVATQQASKSPVPAHSIAPPAYAFNQPNSFVPKRPNSGMPPVPPVTVISPKVVSQASPFFPPSSSGSYNQGDLSGNPSGFSARRLEREQARRMRSAEARALAESQDCPSDILPSGSSAGAYDEHHFGTESPTSSLSSHNDSQSLPRGVSAGAAVAVAAAETPTSRSSHGGMNSVAERVQSFAPFGASGSRDHVIVTSSEASTDREASVAPILQTPPPAQHRNSSLAANAAHDHSSGGNGEDNGDEEDGDEDDDEGSEYMSDDDDMSFNTAEEINTPMLNHHSYQDRDNAPRTRARPNGATTSRHPRNTAARKPGAGPVPAFDFQLTKENLFKFLLLGDGKSARSMLHMLRAADLPVSTVISPEQASVIMMQSFKEPDTLDQPEDTLVLLIETLHADVNHVESDTGKTLLHYMVECENISLGGALISRGGDVLQEDNTSTSPLALNFHQKQEWVLEAFQSSGRLAALLQSGDTERILKLVTCLIFAGHSQQAGEVIKMGNLVISAEDASRLLASCRNNFQNMKDPIETFELLESLGASVDEE